YNLCGLINGTAHAIGTRGQNNFGTVGAQHDTALIGHGFWHRQHNAVATCSADHGQSNTGVPRGALNNGATRTKRAGFFSSVYDCDTDTVFHRVRWVVELDLHSNISRQAFGETVQTDQWCLTDSLGDVIEHLCHMGIILYGC